MLPKTMMTQHPDAASKYVSIQKEPEEAIDALLPEPKGLGIDEVMIDFEGKLTPYQQTAQIVLGLLRHGVKVGSDVWVTPRVPSGREEGVFRQLMALMSIVESNYKALKVTKKPAIKEVVLPMTLQGSELVNLQQRIIDVIELAHKEFGMSPDPVQIRPIPLIESLPAIIDLRSMLTDYKNGLKDMGLKISSMRLMLGRSDLALTYGLGASVLANVIALSDLANFSAEGDLSIAPILGGGTLPFRGHLSLENVDQTLKQYPSVQTFTIQSAMRYDHGRNKALKLASLFKQKAGKSLPAFLSAKRDAVLNILGVFAKNYLQTLGDVLPTVIKISDLIPEQRDRLARKSDVGYARQMPQTKALAEFISDSDVAKELRGLKWAKVDLPRAISFTAAFYTAGLPPELIGTGRSLKEIKERYGNKAIELVNQFYPGLKSDIKFVIRYTNLAVASSFFSPAFMKKTKEDIAYLEDFLSLSFKEDSSLYRTVMETLKPMLKELLSGSHVLSEEGLERELVNELILKLGKLRKALG